MRKPENPLKTCVAWYLENTFIICGSFYHILYGQFHKARFEPQSLKRHVLYHSAINTPTRLGVTGLELEHVLHKKRG